MRLLYFLCIFLINHQANAQRIKLPINAADRSSLNELVLTEIGDFGLLRKERPQIPKHFHTGIDINRTGKNYDENPIFPIADGIVISKRDDGPYAQLIIEHKIEGGTIWTVYEHISGITVGLHDLVFTDHPIARFMNREELNKYGWQFDHFHLEILKKHPIKIAPGDSLKERHFMSYTLKCFSHEDLEIYFYDPVDFLMNNL